MKKILLFIILSLFLIGIVSPAMVLSNREESINYLKAYKESRDLQLKEIFSSINFTTEKECIIDYSFELPICSICFDYILDKEIKSTCISLKENSTLEEDENELKEYLTRETREEVIYTERIMKGRTLNIDVDFISKMPELNSISIGNLSLANIDFSLIPNFNNLSLGNITNNWNNVYANKYWDYDLNSDKLNLTSQDLLTGTRNIGMTLTDAIIKLNMQQDEINGLKTKMECMTTADTFEKMKECK